MCANLSFFFMCVCAHAAWNRGGHVWRRGGGGDGRGRVFLLSKTADFSLSSCGFWRKEIGKSSPNLQDIEDLDHYEMKEEEPVDGKKSEDDGIEKENLAILEKIRKNQRQDHLNVSVAEGSG